LSLDDGHIGMMQQAIQQSGNASSVRKDFVPFFKGSIGGENDRLAFVTAIDDFLEEVSRLVVKGKKANFVHAQQTDVGIGTKLMTTSVRTLALQLF
jgi:hypothetical protein